MLNQKLPWEIADLIAAQWGGELTDDQQRRLQEWIEASPRHKMLYERVCREENFGRYMLAAGECRYKARYEEFCGHMTRVKRRRRMRRLRYAAAAIMLLPLAVAGWWYLQQKPEVKIGQENIVPGQYQALLTLPGGETVCLPDAKGKLEETNAYFDRDTLSYEATEAKGSEEIHKISIPRGGEYMLRLADGTQVWLNAETELSFPAVFTGSERRVTLKGEAYFQVRPDSLHPFVVEAGDQRLTVLGTSFGLRAYADEGRILTTLETGKVKVEAADRQVVLQPGEQARYENNTVRVEKVNTALYTAWHKGMFIFSDQSLEDILHTLARWYNMEVVYQTPEIKGVLFTGELPRYGDIRELLDKMELLEKVKFEIHGRTVAVLKYERKTGDSAIISR